MTYVTKLSEKAKISQHQNAQSDPVDAEGGEAALADVFHKPTDHQYAYKEADDTANGQYAPFCGGGSNAFHQEFEKLQGAGAQHGGDGQEEGKLCACASAHTQKESTQDCRAGTGCAGDQA